MAKRFKELRDKMSPQARAAAEKKTQRMTLALDITERLFGEAPLHLKNPQVDELAKLDLNQLLLIAQIKRFPISKSLRGKIVSALGSDNLVVRMEKRWRLASSVISAEKEGRYEAAEHATGMLDFGEEFSIGPIQLSAEGTKALFELIENPPEPSPALKKAMTEANGRRLKEEDKCRFFELAGRLSMSTDAEERRELKKQLAQMTFGDNRHIGSNFDEIEKEKLLKQMKKASQDPLFMKDLDESMKAFEAADTKKASTKAKRNKHAGSNFDDFLKEEGTLKESETAAVKRVKESERSKRKMKGNK